MRFTITKSVSRSAATVAVCGVLVAGPTLTAGTASAAEGVPLVGPNETSVIVDDHAGPVGNSGFPVECVQRALLRTPDGDYGQDTFDAIRRFQKLHGLEADGIVGPRTGDRLIPSLPDSHKTSCFDVIPTTYDLETADDQPIVPGPTVSRHDFLRCMDENGTGLGGLVKITKIRKLYKLLKQGRQVDGAEIARTVPGTDLVMMFSCLRHGPPR